MRKKLLIGLMFIATVAIAQSGGDFLINKSTVGAGGGVANGGAFKVTGSIGQKEAQSKISGGGYNLSGGFWFAGTREDVIFINSFE